MRIKTLLFIFFCLFGRGAAGEDILSPGGLSVDLSKTVMPGKSKAVGPNVVDDGHFDKGTAWRPNLYISPCNSVNPEDVRKLLLSFASLKLIREEDGNFCVECITSDDVGKSYANVKESASFLNNCGREFFLKEPLETDATYLVSFRYKGKTTSADNVHHGLYATISVLNSKRERLGIWAKTLPLRVDWENCEFSFKAPAGTKEFAVSIGLAGCGYCRFDDVAIREADAPPERMAVNIYPMDLFSPNYFEMREKSIVPFTLAPFGRKDGRQLDIFFKLPKGIDYLAHASTIGNPQKMDAIQLVSEEADGKLFKMNASRLDMEDFPFWARNGALLLRNHLPAGSKTAIIYYAQDKSFKTTPRTCEILVTKAEPAATPKRFLSGGLFVGDVGYDTLEGIRFFSEFYCSTGYNFISADVCPKMRERLRAGGIAIGRSNWWLLNGYTIGDQPKPREICFLDVNGNIITEKSRSGDSTRRSLCPTVVYRKLPYYTNEVTAMLDREYTENKCEYIQSNWEPFSYDFKGCFCERCRDEFALWAKLDQEKVKQVWPKEVIKTYRTQWIAFRNWQHGMLVKTILNTLEELGKTYGRQIEFNPQLVYLIAVLDSGYCDQYKLEEFVRYLKGVVLWGPYNYYDMEFPFVRNIGLHLQTWNAGRLNNEYMAHYIPNPAKQPKLFALPHFLQGRWVTEPEACAFETLCYLMLGWQGSSLYIHPLGVDNRFWNAIAGMNRQIAAYEDFTFDGRPYKNFCLEPVSRLPIGVVSSWTVKPVAADMINQPLLQGAAYRLQDRTLVGAANFWENGECFFRLKINGLDNDKRWYVTQPDQHTSFGDFSVEELEKGILLHVGALRWAFFVISAQDSEMTVAISQEEINSACQQRFHSITAQCQADQKYIDSATQRDAVVVNDFSTQPEIINEDVSLKPDGTLLAVAAPEYTAKLDLNHGGILRSVRSAGEKEFELAGKEGIGLTRILSPGKKMEFLTGGFKLTKIERLDNSVIRVIAERHLPAGNTPVLKNLLIRKTFDFSGNRITVAETFFNKTGKPLTLTVSSHNYPALLQLQSGQSGKVEMNDAVFIRNGMPKTYQTGEKRPQSSLQKIYQDEKAERIAGNSIRMSAPWTSVAMTVFFNPKETDFLAFWDTYDMEVSTFEIISLSFELGEGESKTLSISWQIQ